MSCDDSQPYALQCLWNAPSSEACDGTEQCRLLSDQQADLIQRELSMLSPHRRAQPIRGESGRSLGHVYGVSAVTSFNSCPNPDLETVSLLHRHWIRPDLTRSPSHLQQSQPFPMLLSNQRFYMASVNSLPVAAKNVHPHCNKPILHEMLDNNAYLATGSRRTFLRWQSWMLLQIPSQ